MRNKAMCGYVLSMLIAVTGASAREPDLSKPLTLEACLTLAMERHPQVRSAEHQLDRAGAEVLAAWSSVLPDVSATAFGFGRVTTGPSVRIQETPVGVDPVTNQPLYEQKEVVFTGFSRNSYSWNASLSQTLYDGGRSRHTIRQARRGQQAAGFGLQERQAVVRLAVQRQYYAVLTAQKLVTVHEEAVARSQQQVEKTESLLAIGSGIEADVLRSKVALGTDRMALITAQHTLRRAQAELSTTLGLDVATPIEVVDHTDPPRPLLALRHAVETAIARHPEVQRRRHEVQAAEAGVSVARSAYLPSVSASIGYNRGGEEIGRVYQQFDKNYQITISTAVTYQLFDGFAKRASLTRATATMYAAEEELEQARRTVTLAVQTAVLDLERLRQIAEITTAQITSAAEDLRLAEERYRVGTGTFLEVMDAQVNLTKAQVNLVQTAYDVQIAEAELDYATGGGE